MKNLETYITQAIRDVLHIMKVPHFKHWAGKFSPKGIPDIIGTIPGTGRALYIEVKTPSGTLKPDQRAFLEAHGGRGALAFVAHDAKEAVEYLAMAGFEPAKKLLRSMK